MNCGCLFTDGRLVLAGWQKDTVSGLGGKAAAGEIPIETAWRETLEELFDMSYTAIRVLLPIITSHIQPSRSIQDAYYTSFVYTFKDLEKALSILKTYHVVSPFYRIFPISVAELVIRRKALKSAEVSTLALVPLVARLNIAPDFVRDLAALHDSITLT